MRALKITGDGFTTDDFERDWYQYFLKLDIDHFAQFLYHYYAFRGPTVGHIQKHVPTGGSIIELGCGTGLLGILFSSMGYDVTGVERDAGVAKLARENNDRLGGKLRVIQMDMRDPNLLRIRPRPFDLAYSEGVVEHYQGTELDKLMRIHGALGVKQMIVVPSQDDPLVTDQDTYSFRALQQICRRNGLMPVDRFVMGTSLMKWSKLLLPPILLKRLHWLKWEDVGIICTRDSSW